MYPDEAIMTLLTQRLPEAHLIVAGRADTLRPNVDLLGVGLPRRTSVPVTIARGWLVNDVPRSWSRQPRPGDLEKGFGPSGNSGYGGTAESLCRPRGAKMTSPRVLATQQARDAAQQLITSTGQLKEQINKVIQQGKILAEPNNWDGQLAQKWRQEWETDSKQLQQASQKMDEIDNKAKQAVDNIIKAGGG
ncbi:MAG: hypothetical protein ACRES5_14420 [Pseudomonas sp.]